jgi:hypothetical protein
LSFERISCIPLSAMFSSFSPISMIQGQKRAFLSCEDGVLGNTEGRRYEKLAAATPLRAAVPHRAATDI